MDALLNGVFCKAAEIAKDQDIATQRGNAGFTCLQCHEPLQLTNGTKVDPYFRHNIKTPDTPECPLRDLNSKESHEILSSLTDNFYNRMIMFVELPHRTERFNRNGQWRDALNAEGKSISFRGCESTVGARSDIAILDIFDNDRSFGGLTRVGNKLLVTLAGKHEIWRIDSDQVILDGRWDHFLKVIGPADASFSTSTLYEIEPLSVTNILDRVFIGIANYDVDVSYRSCLPTIEDKIHCQQHGLVNADPDGCDICNEEARQIRLRQQELEYAKLQRQAFAERQEREYAKQQRQVCVEKVKPSYGSDTFLRKGLKAALSVLLDRTLNPSLKPAEKQRYENKQSDLIRHPAKTPTTYPFINDAHSLLFTKSKRRTVNTRSQAEAILNWVRDYRKKPGPTS